MRRILGCAAAERVKLVGRSYQFRMRVPKRFAGVEARKEIYVSFKTGDIVAAHARAAELELKLDAAWEARLAGENPDFTSIVRYRQTLGFATSLAVCSLTANFPPVCLKFRPRIRRRLKRCLALSRG
ncbi:DUF6538 domain-containing protein [Phaeobacter sp. B1627]|uniref:DUF6538 domain-containing protein n=1 Tax=Phaeobacter sp. B1627 TaxID=2583809 RepID=UPI0035167FEC